LILHFLGQQLIILFVTFLALNSGTLPRSFTPWSSFLSFSLTGLSCDFRAIWVPFFGATVFGFFRQLLPTFRRSAILFFH